MSNQSTIGSQSIIQSLGNAWDNVKANVWLFAGFSLLYFIISGTLSLVPFLGRAASLFSFIFSASIFSALNIYDRTKRLDFNDFFKWSPKFGHLFLGNLLLGILVVLMLIPFAFILVAILGVGFFTEIASSNPESIKGLFVGSTIVILIIAILLFVIVVSIALFAFPYIIQFTDLSYSEALSYSFKIGRNNIGQVVLFAFVAVGLSIVGLVFCGIGLLITIPLIIATQYYFLHDMISEKEPEVAQWDFMQQNPE